MSSSLSLDRAPLKIIFVVGGTGAQGMPVIRALLEPQSNGHPSPWGVRALTRNPDHRRAKELSEMGVELVKGSFFDYDTVLEAMEGCYGAYINTDGFSGDVLELHAGIRIFELAQSVGIRHYVWSSVDCVSKKGRYSKTYPPNFYNSKSRVSDFIRSQDNEVDDPDGTMWTVCCTGPYMEMLTALFAPITQRADGTFIFAHPIGSGNIPMLALDDLGWWARHIFDDPKAVAGKYIEVASEVVTWPHLVETFTRVTGLKAEFVPLSMEDYFSLMKETAHCDHTSPRKYSECEVTIESSFAGFWGVHRDGLITRDMDWIRSVHPNTMSLEQWMIKNKYDGKRNATLLKNTEDSKSKLAPDLNKVLRL